MPTKVIMLLAIGMSLLLTGSMGTQSLSQEQGAKPLTLDLVVEQAKASGRQEISLPTGVINDYGVAQNADDALSFFNLAVATVIYKKSFVDDSDHIKTWYKF